MSSIEVVVALTLLAAVISLGTPLVVRHGRLLAQHRDYQRALEEISNQMERLAALPADELETAVEDLQPSAFAAETLPGAKIEAELIQADMGRRLVLSLTWEGRPTNPVSLVAWVYPQPTSSSEETEAAR
jgi:hypothetical protein